MTFPADLPNLGGNTAAARSRRDLLVAGHDGRMLTETIDRPLLRAQQAEAAPLSGIAQFSIPSGRQALANARCAEGPVLKYVNAVEVELLLFICYAEGQHETGYHVAMQAVRALDRARKTATEGQPEDMDPQALETAYELVAQTLDAAEAVTTAPTP